MPSIIVVPDAFEDQATTYTLKERVPAAVVQDPHLAAQLLQRVAWAVEDAEREPAPDGPRAP